MALLAYFRSFIGLLPTHPSVYHFRRIRIRRRRRRPKSPRWVTFQIVLNSLQLAIEVWIWDDFSWILWQQRRQSRSVFLWLVFHLGYFGLSGFRAISTTLSGSLPKPFWLGGNEILIAFISDDCCRSGTAQWKMQKIYLGSHGFLRFTRTLMGALSAWPSFSKLLPFFCCSATSTASTLGVKENFESNCLIFFVWVHKSFQAQ